MRSILLALPFALLPLAVATAHDGHDHDHDDHGHAHEHGSLGAHVHGIASLNLALEGSKFEIELDSPAINLVGFEHQASSDADKAKLTAARAALDKFGELPQDVLEGTRRSRFAPPIVRRHGLQASSTGTDNVPETVAADDESAAAEEAGSTVSEDESQ